MLTALHVPLTLALLGIVLRGSAFAFRRYDRRDDATHRRWSTLFGVSSMLTPFFLGLSLGGLAGGEIRVVGGHVVTGFFAGWTSPFALGCGLFAQVLFAYLAATYLTVDTEGQSALQEDFRRRALAAGLTLAPVAALVFALARDGAPVIYRGLPAGWGLAQYPYLVVPDLTVAGARTAGTTLRLLLWALAAGALLLFPSFIYLYRVFKRRDAPPADG